MVETYSKLYVATLTPEQHERTCNYWFTVHTSAFNHTAFEKREHFMQWLAERGLELTEPLADTGTYSWQEIKGAYRSHCHRSYNEFYALEGERIKVMSNADYTLGIVTLDADGIRTVHYLNPNCRDRPVYDYQTTRAEIG